MSKVLQFLFGCRHANYSFPQTAKGNKRRSAAASLTGTYVVCLDCGHEFSYDWQNMKIIAGAPDQNIAAEAAYANKAA
jgi:hypothetical protein